MMVSVLQQSTATLLVCCFLSFTSISAWTTRLYTPSVMQSRLYNMNPNAKYDAMLDFMNRPVQNSVADRTNDASPADDEDLINLVTSIVKAADGRKAENIVALRVSHVSTLTSFLVIVTGNSRPQNQAIASAVVKTIDEEYEIRTQGNGVPEGSADSGWMLLDYGSVMVHIMTPKSRLFYDIEGQWREKGGEELELSHVLVPNTMADSSASAYNDEDAALGGSMNLPEEDDPFWS